jgi:hypothetical protein
MKKKTIWMTTALALMVALPGAAVFAASTDDTTAGASSVQPQVSANENKELTREGRGRGGKGGFGPNAGKDFRGPGGHIEKNKVAGGMHGVHSETYMLLLAEKYAPVLVSEFKAAYDQGEQLESQLKAAKDAENTDRAAKQEEMKTALEAIKAKVTSGELTQEQANEQIKQLREAGKGTKPVRVEQTAEQAAQMEAKKLLHEEFQAAAQALTDNGSTELIANVLPKLLADLKAHNQQLTDRLAAQ